MTAPPVPPGLGARGRRLWRDLAPAGANRVLAEEACRIADRLDRLAAVLAGDVREWMQLRIDEAGVNVVVTVDAVLAEARQQAMALKQILAELRQGSSAAQAAPKEASFVDQLAARRATRITGAAGS